LRSGEEVSTTVQFSVTTQIDYLGPLTNVARVSTEEGATGAYTVTVEVKKWTFCLLPMILRNMQ
jgi:hypothetical protein